MIYRAIEIFNSQCIDLAANNGSSENLFWSQKNKI
jgi:hypothetical protein